MDQVRKVGRAHKINGTKAHARNLVSIACFYREPVQSVEVWGDMVSLWDFQD